jgi:hypothetical protein
MDPNSIQLTNLNKSFEYEKVARDIDSISDIDELRNLAKSFMKLYLKQEEVLSELKWPNPVHDKN